MDKEKDWKFILVGIVVTLVIAGLLGMPVMLLSGWLTQMVWGWLAVPLGFGALTLGQAMAVTALVGWFRMSDMKEDEKAAFKSKYGENVVTIISVVRVPLALVLCYFVHWYMG